MSKDKLIPEMRFPEFMQELEWTETPLGDLCEVITKGTTPTTLGFKYTESGINFIKIESIDDGIINLNKVAHISDECHDALKRSQLLENDILFSIAGALGVVAPVHEKDLPANTNQALAIVRLKNEISQAYILKYLNSPSIETEIIKIKAGAAQPNISLTQVGNFNILLPQPQEQQKIASCLSSLDELLAAHNEKLDLLIDHKKGLMQNLFPQEGETVPKVRFEEFEGDGEWVEDELSNCADVVDPHPSHRAPVAVSDGIPFIGIGDVTEQGELNLKNVRLVPKEILDEHRERYQLKVGDFAYGRVASVGKVVDLSKNIDKDYTYSPTMAIVQPKRVNASFLKHFCNSSYFITQVIAKTSGSTRKSIGMQNLRILNISMPSSTDEQQKIASCLSAIDELINAQADKIEQLQQHKKGLMQGLFPKIES